MNALRRSVRARLIAILLAGLAVVWVAMAAATLVEADHEVEEIFDAHLAQSATLLAMRIGEEADEIDLEHAPVPHKYAQRLSFQIWKHGKRLLLHSADAPDTPFSARERGFSTVNEGGREWRVFSQWDAKGEYLVQVRDAVRDRRHVIVDIAKGLAMPLAVALPLLALVVWLSVGRAFRPIARIGEEISRRDPRHLAPLQGDVPSEVSPLVERLNALFSRVRSSLDGERRFTSDAAHELRTPLAALRAQLQVAQGAGDAPGRDRALSQALAAADRATRVVEQLLTLARLEHNAWREAAKPFDLRAVAAQALAERADRARAAGVELALEGLDAAEVVGQSGLADIALGNLLDNAIGHSPSGATVSIFLEREGHQVAARVRDQGPGIPPARREEALGRFTRLDDESREGSGLGLSIVARIADLHGSPLALGDAPGGRGLEATLRFPAARV